MYRRTPVKAFGQRNLPKPVEQTGRRASLLANALVERQAREAEQAAREAEERRQAEAALRLKQQRAEERRQKALNAARWPVEQTREVARKAAEPVHKLAKASEQAGERLVHLSKAAGQASKGAAKSLGDAGREAAQDIRKVGWGVANGVGEAGKKAGKGISGTAAGIATGVGQAGKGIAGGVQSAGKGIAGGVRSAGKGVADGAKDLGKGVSHGAKDLGKGIAGGIRLTGSAVSKAVEGTGREISTNLRDAGAITRLSLLNMGQEVADGVRDTGREISATFRDAGEITRLSLLNVSQDVASGIRDTGREVSDGLNAARSGVLKTGQGIARGLQNVQRTTAENLRDAGDITRLTFIDVGQDISAGLRDRGRELSEGLEVARQIAQCTGEGVAQGLRDAHRGVSQNLREAGEITRASFLDVGKDVTDGWNDRRQEMSHGLRRARQVAGGGLLIAGQGIATGWRAAYGGVAANLRDAGEITHATFRDLGHDITEGGFDRLREARAAAALAARVAELGLRTVKKIDLSPVAAIPGHVSRRAAIIGASVDAGVRQGAAGIRGAFIVLFMLPVRLSRVVAAVLRFLGVRLVGRWHAVQRKCRNLTARARWALAQWIADLRRALAWSGVWLKPAAVAGLAVAALVYAGSLTNYTAIQQFFDRSDTTAETSDSHKLVAENTVPADVERHPLILPPAPADLPKPEKVPEQNQVTVAEAREPAPKLASKASGDAETTPQTADAVPTTQESAPSQPKPAAKTQVAEARTIPRVEPQRKPARHRPAVSPAAKAVRVAIVIDDMGMDHRMLSRFVALPGEITFAFLPYAPNLKSQTREALAAGHQLIVHMPMEPKDAATDPGRNALLTGLSTAELERRITWNLDRFDGFVGINNHMGSKFTEDAASMSLVMAMLHQRGLFYLDSLTTAASSGYRLAGAAGVPRLRRDVFLDNDQDVDAILKQLRETQRIASVVGRSIAIGHPHRQTLAALQRWIPEAQAAGVQLVAVSTLLPATPAPRVASATAGQP